MSETIGVGPELRVLRELADARRQIAVLEAEGLVLLNECVKVRERDGDHAAGSVSDEIALELRVGKGCVRDQLRLVAELPVRLPGSFVAVRAGSIDVFRARALYEVAEPLSVDDARVVEAKVLPHAHTCTPSQLRARARYHRDRVDPTAAERRREQAREWRRVGVDPGQGGEGELTVTGDGDRAYLMWLVVDTAARKLRNGGDERELDALRFDVLVDMVLGKFQSRVQVHAYLHVPATTVAGITGDPGILVGYGPVTAQRCRELAAGSALWQRVLFDPVTSIVKDLDRRRYRPPGGLAAYVKVRDGSCIAPGCTKSAYDCQLDHTIPWAESGCTCSDNLDALCLAHHRLRHLCGWSINQVREGVFEWVSPVGPRFTRLPVPILESVA